MQASSAPVGATVVGGVSTAPDAKPAPAGAPPTEASASDRASVRRVRHTLMKLLRPLTTAQVHAGVAFLREQRPGLMNEDAERELAKRGYHWDSVPSDWIADGGGVEYGLVRALARARPCACKSCKEFERLEATNN